MVLKTKQKWERIFVIHVYLNFMVKFKHVFKHSKQKINISWRKNCLKVYFNILATKIEECTIFSTHKNVPTCHRKMERNSRAFLTFFNTKNKKWRFKIFKGSNTKVRIFFQFQFLWYVINYFWRCLTFRNISLLLQIF